MKASLKLGKIIGLIFFLGFIISPTSGFSQEQPKKPLVHKKVAPKKKLINPLKKKAKVTKDLKFDKIN